MKHSLTYKSSLDDKYNYYLERYRRKAREAIKQGGEMRGEILSKAGFEVVLSGFSTDFKKASFTEAVGKFVNLQASDVSLKVARDWQRQIREQRGEDAEIPSLSALRFGKAGTEFKQFIADEYRSQRAQGKTSYEARQYITDNFYPGSP